MAELEAALNVCIGLAVLDILNHVNDARPRYRARTAIRDTTRILPTASNNSPPIGYSRYKPMAHAIDIHQMVGLQRGATQPVGALTSVSSSSTPRYSGIQVEIFRVFIT